MATQYKSVRIPDDIVTFVKQQPGKDFSKKLVGILYAYQDIIESTERQNRINDYNKVVREIERLTIRLRMANDKLADLNSALENKPACQLSFNTDLGELVVNK